MKKLLVLLMMSGLFAESNQPVVTDNINQSTHIEISLYIQHELTDAKGHYLFYKSYRTDAEFGPSVEC